MMMPTLATSPAEPSSALRTLPRLIGRFAVRSEIGRGSNGVVYSAVDPMLGREIAIKAIPLTTDDFFRRQIEANFLQEAKSAAILNHPGIVTVFDAGKTEDLAYIAMERLHGRDLHEFLAAGESLNAHQAAQLMARVADAVHYAHKKGLIHRDIKPSNIFLLRDLKPKVLDFGIALANRSESPAIQKRQLIGTPNYMSPEQALGRPLDARSDVFSLGSILYEVLAGRRAFDGKNVEDTVGQVIANTPTPLELLRPDTPRPLIEIIARATATDTEQRYASAGELRNALTAFLSVTAPATARRGSVRATEQAALHSGFMAGLLDSARSSPILTGAVALLMFAALSLAGVSLLPHVVGTVGTVGVVGIEQTSTTAVIAPTGAPVSASTPLAQPPTSIASTLTALTPSATPPTMAASSSNPGITASPNRALVSNLPSGNLAAIGSTPGTSTAESGSSMPTFSVAVSPVSAAPASTGSSNVAAVNRAGGTAGAIAEPKRRVRQDSGATVPIGPPPDGAVSLAVAPWGEVFVNGALRGVSPPLARLILPPGIHNIEIRNGDAPTFTAQVEVKSGQTLSVQHRF